jgi:cyanate permease
MLKNMSWKQLMCSKAFWGVSITMLNVLLGSWVAYHTKHAIELMTMIQIDFGAISAWLSAIGFRDAQQVATNLTDPNLPGPTISNLIPPSNGN